MPLLHPLLISHHRSLLPCQDGAVFTHFPDAAGEACDTNDGHLYVLKMDKLLLDQILWHCAHSGEIRKITDKIDWLIDFHTHKIKQTKNKT